MVYLILSIPMGFVATWLLDTYGIRPSLLIGSWVTVVGAVVRCISTLHIIPSSWAFPLAIAGQIIAASVYPIFVSCPSKVSEQWCRENERTLSTMITTTGFGFIFGNLLSPILIKYKGVQFMLIMYTIPVLLGAVLTTVGLCTSVPPSPPSASASHAVQPFWTGLKQILRIKYYWILILLTGIGGALSNSLTILAEEMMCTHGYEPTFSGIVLGVQNAVGIVGGVAASIFTDRTRLFEETAKVTLALSSVFTSLMMVTSCIPHQEVLIVIFFMCQGIVSSASYPVTVELMIETSYPVAEATSLGLSLIVMHVQAIIFTFVLESLSRPMTEYERIHQKCISAHHNPSYNNTQPKDMTVAMLFYAGLSALQAIGIIIFFKSENRRIKKEKIEKIIVNNQCSMNEDKPLNI